MKTVQTQVLKGEKGLLSSKQIKQQLKEQKCALASVNLDFSNEDAG